ncbi:conserved hypothetical protein [Leptothrix cholodnii SP-6]|uniref:ORC1/DEAH AAA+ ATPase domain-containing protein n=1 Tax=Leptothrix cholodnii (strain ATCC 51168 / LMG 8142 / SP-6) TaxID=395495 RepID=B1Y418_LEPCP|nr:AAA family ATPase [Leptothrix cholodnii]ACB34540.1 conserved hypothetical protein [Leptothrix cholodnii SP-6]
MDATLLTPEVPDVAPQLPPRRLGVLHVAGVAHDVYTLAEMAVLLRVSLSDAARSIKLPRTTVYRLFNLGEWPTRMSDEMLKVTANRLILLFNNRGGKRPEVARIVRATLPGALVIELDDESEDTPDTKKDEPMLMAKQTLSPAARKAFTLFTNPFDGEVIDDTQMFTNGEIAYVREACMQAATGGRFVAVVSESGGGKTTMLGDLEARIQRDRKPVIVIKPWVLGMEDNDTKGKTLKSTDILASVVTTLDQLASLKQTLQGRSNQAKDLLVKSAEAGYSHLLVIEEAHSLPEATLKHLKRLHEMRLGRKPLLGILLLGQTELALKLDPRRASLREVTQRCEVVHLLPLDGDLRAYLEHRARAAGRELGDFIDQSGVDELRTRLTITRPASGGKTAATSLLYPLAVNNLVTAALNVAADLGVPVINRDVVRAV